MRSRLLVVAKDTELRARLARRLSRMGHGVELAESISHARHVISGKKFCLAILSLDGVGPEGFDFADELRSVVGETLLIGTGNNFGATKHEDLIDPSDDDTLMARVNHAVRRQHTTPIRRGNRQYILPVTPWISTAPHSSTREVRRSTLPAENLRCCESSYAPPGECSHVTTCAPR